MKREIVFRGMDISGNWHYGLLAESAGFPGQPEAGVYISNMAGAPWAYQVRMETVSQFIGRPDRSGKKIYKNDILSTDYGWIGTVEYDSETAKYIVKHKSGKYYDFDLWWNETALPGSQWERHIFEVIGNIHENPGLLK